MRGTDHSNADRVERLRQSYNEETRLRWAVEEERDKWRGLCEMVDAHYSGSLDHRPGYVRAIRAALDEESP